VYSLRSHLLAFAFFAAFFALSGCAQHLSIEPGPSSKSSFCAELMRGIPVELADQLIRSTKPSDSGVAAWGDPAIVLRCGVSEPTSLTSTSQLIAINGVDWLPEPLTNGTRFTSVNTSEFIEVNIPSTYEPASNLLVDLARAFPTN
jgi:hypothetical protein